MKIQPIHRLGRPKASSPMPMRIVTARNETV